MSTPVEELEPRALWRHFVALSRIPRCSKHEADAVAWIEELAREKGCATRRDDVGNLLVEIPASPGCENAPTVILQGHVDMVCEKNSDVEHDFARDPIVPVIDGEWVRARGTTLGADNGIGVCMGLALLDAKDLVHGPLELLMTVDEETGLTGAMHIAPGFMRGSRLINLDSEELGVFTVGCAGGQDSVLELRAPRTASSGTALRLSVGGLLGGHSGQDIAKNRGHSLRILARLLSAAREAEGVRGLRLGLVAGGSKRNAIPREATALLSVPAASVPALRETIARVERECAEQVAGIEPDFKVTLQASEAPEGGFADETASARLLDLILTLPQGVLAMNVDIPTLVETSNNVGVIDDLGDGWRLTCASRTSNAPAMEDVSASIRAAGRLAGASVAHGNGYPGWKPNLGSELLARAKRVYQRLAGHEAQVEAIHAGLECGLLTEKYPDLDILSYGPKIVDAHSPAERVDIASVKEVYDFTCALLEDLARA